MILFIDHQPLDDLIPKLRQVSSTLSYKHMYYDAESATSSSTNKRHIKTELQQFGVKEGSLNLDVVHEVCNVFYSDIDIRTIGFVKIDPNQKIGKHVDNKINRRTTLSIPLTPQFKKYAPVRFEFNVEWKDKIFFMPTEKPHSVENNSYQRINFQLGFGYSIDHIKHLYNTGRLFR